MASSDIGGGWQLDAQHKYNFHAGILQKGDGHTVYLKYKPHVSSTIFIQHGSVGHGARFR